MFIDRTTLIRQNPAGNNYGIAVTDLDADGQFEVVVASHGAGNILLKWNGDGFTSLSDPTLADTGHQAIGVAAGDLDGDGREELYVLNTDTFGGAKIHPDRLFDFQNGKWIDLFSLPQHKATVNLTAGRSVACVDRLGTGRYGFFVANYGGPMRLYELDDRGNVQDVAPQAGLNLSTGGRGLLSLPLVSPHMDIFAANEGGANYLFRNRGDGVFEEVGQDLFLGDMYENARGVAVLDANDDGLFDIALANWQGPNRLFVQGEGGRFHDKAPRGLAAPSRVRTLLAADFDNDGYEELFFNNLGQPNRLFGRHGETWVTRDVGDAREADGLGTGAAVGDFDGDGRLELIIAHGESAPQPLRLYHTPDTGNAWLRVLPLTRAGAPARGAVVRLKSGDLSRIRAIDAGSGYLCQMEPVAHFGLGRLDRVDWIEVQWPDGHKKKVSRPPVGQTITVPYPD